ncbi:MAG: elongation factor P-like protein YeiP [Gammaproteobacteria bacterium]|nr:elongation factor P-like protein YeiP [Gammaproteobacteria bacterium]MDH5515585.1 elongation factor P-like protein YeiP [Gammaproteobacteria bacterium]
MKASDLKKGQVIDIDGRSILVRDLDVQSPSSRSGSTLYKVRGVDIVSKQKYENRFKGDENIDTVEFSRRPVQFLFQDGDTSTFMDKETFEQYMLNTEDIADEMRYLGEDLDGILAMIADGNILGIELPATVVLEITDTAPGMKAASASSRTKPATLSTGLVVQIPEYLTPGEQIKINTTTGEYISRA